jgi:hypothetical protein
VAELGVELAPLRPGAAARAGGLALRAWAAAALVAAIFFLPALAPHRQFGYFDNGRMHVPMKRYVADELRAGRFPAWNPYAGMGTPIAAGGVDAVLHPFNLLLVAFPFDLGFKLWVLLCFPVAGAGAAALARRVGAPPGPALAGGIAFMLSGYAVSMTGNMQYLGALAFFPWILARGLAYAERPTPARAGLVALGSGLCAASGDPQGWAIAVGLVPALAAALPPEGVPRVRAALRGVAAAGWAVAAALPFVVPVLAWIPHSGRGEPFDAHEYEHFNLLPVRALELLVPHVLRTSGRELASELNEAWSGNRLTPFPWALSVYAGAATFALALLGAWRRRAARVALAGAALFTWMAMGPNAGFGQLARPLPVLGNLRYWEKLAVWPSLLLAVAAALGLAVLVERRADARRLGLAALAAGAALLAAGASAAAAPALAATLLGPAGASPAVAAQAAANARDGLLHAGAVAALLGGVALAIAAGRLTRPLLAAGALLAVDLAAANVRAYVLSDVESTRPPSPAAARLRAEPGLQRLLTPFGLYPDDERYTAGMEEAWRLGAEGLYAAWNVPERIGNLEIYSGMLPVRSNRFWRRAGRKDRLPDVGLWGFGWLYLPPRLTDSARRFVPSEAAPVAAAGVRGELLRLPARPRAYLAERIEGVDRRGAMEFALATAEEHAGRTVVEGEVPAGLSPPLGEVRLVRDVADALDLTVKSDRPALLVLNDVFTVGWTATVDGADAQILPVNYLARGVWIGAGSHEIRFRYRTPWLREAWAALAAAALGAIVWQLRRARGEPR